MRQKARVPYSSMLLSGITWVTLPALTRAQELCESRGGRPGLPIPKSPYGLCGCKATLILLSVRAQELCESLGGHPGLPVPNSSYDLCGCKVTLNHWHSEFRSCVKVEVAVLGSPSLISLMVSVDVKQHWNECPHHLLMQVAMLSVWGM